MIDKCIYLMHVSRTRTHRLLLYLGPGRGGSRLSRDTQTSLSPDTSSSTSRGSPRRSQARWMESFAFQLSSLITTRTGTVSPLLQQPHRSVCQSPAPFFPHL
ncbi:hypothetical protein ILYODFUR_030668 [Ilyodon furcidens]|uniref:Uncharacterized protein n=1 Tax=Ilyodon furcidens TaxID=33524 RepID=A0ABV0T507_9TELE